MGASVSCSEKINQEIQLGIQSHLQFCFLDDKAHISGYPPKKIKIPIFSDRVICLQEHVGYKKNKKQKIHLKFFHFYHFLGQKRVFLALFDHEIVYTALKISKNTINVWH